jgi:hypothetical protein
MFKKKTAEAPAKMEWPDTTPIDKIDPYWEFNNNTNINGIPYFKEEVEPGRWQWVVDKESLQRQRDHEKHKSDLAMALQTRVLTEEEMQEVMEYGIHLFIRNMVSYREEDMQRRFNEAICQQYRLRAILNPSNSRGLEPASTNNTSDKEG